MPTINGKACVANGRNLIVQSDLKGGYLDPITGVAQLNEINFYSDNYIATNGATVFTLSSPDYAFKGDRNHDRIAMYDSNKNYLGYQRLDSATQTLSKSNVAYIRFSINFVDEGGTAGKLSDWLSAHRYKLEKGSIATPLTPAPVDKVFSNGVQVYGRNLITSTGQDIIIDDTANTDTKGFKFRVFSLTQQLKVGDQITVSAEGTLTGLGDLSTYAAVFYDSNITQERSDGYHLTAGTRSSITIEVNNLNGTGDTVLLIYAGNAGNTGGKKNVIHHLKVEFSSVATPWTPAPEDVM